LKMVMISKESSFDTDSRKFNLPSWQSAPKIRYFETKIAHPSSRALIFKKNEFLIYKGAPVV
jgi:hypothetical protein